MIRPGTRHRAIGQMKVLIVVFPSSIRKTSGLTSHARQVALDREDRHEQTCYLTVSLGALSLFVAAAHGADDALD
jgi:hypothetical protein